MNGLKKSMSAVISDNGFFSRPGHGPFLLKDLEEGAVVGQVGQSVVAGQVLQLHCAFVHEVLQLAFPHFGPVQGQEKHRGDQQHPARATSQRNQRGLDGSRAADVKMKDAPLRFHTPSPLPAMTRKVYDPGGRLV